MDFDHFTNKELALDVRKSGLYHSDKIIERMQQLFEEKVKEVASENDQEWPENREKQPERYGWSRCLLFPPIPVLSTL